MESTLQNETNLVKKRFHLCGNKLTGRFRRRLDDKVMAELSAYYTAISEEMTHEQGLCISLSNEVEIVIKRIIGDRQN